MPASLTPVEKQVARVGRRLALQSLLDSLVLAWIVALVLALLWFLAQPLILGHNDDIVRWAVAGTLVGLATLAALLRTWINAPSKVNAALALDEKFGLRERVTTSLTLTPDQLKSQAAAALMADVSQRVGKLDVSGRFPLRLSWSALLVPGFAVVLALLSFFYEPTFGGNSTAEAKAKANRVVNADEIKKKMEELRKIQEEKKDQPKSEDFKKIEDAWNKLLDQPLDPANKEEVRERLAQLKPVEEQLKARMDDLREKSDANQKIKNALKKLQRDDVKKPDKKPGDNPDNDLQDALAKGDMEKAADILEKLERKLKDGNLSPDERKQNEQQMQDLKRQLDRLVDQEDQKDQLQKDFADMKIDQDELERELDRLQQDAELLKELKELADKLGQCKQCLGKGNFKQAQMDLKELIEQLKKLDPNNKELQDLEDQELLLLEMRRTLAQGLNGGPPGGPRQFAPDAEVKFKDERQKLQENEKGKLRVVGFGQGGTFSKVPAREVEGAFRQAVQDAPEAMDRTRVPPEYADFLRGYYENLGGQGKKK